MTAPLARAVMAVAVRCLGHERRGWGMAMQAEFEVVAGEGQGTMLFALGCLAAGLRELPVRAEGQMALAGHAIACALILPVAAMLVTELLPMPGLRFAAIVVRDRVATAPAGAPLNDANLAAVPALMLLVLLLVAAHLRLAWLVASREWPRALATAALAAAATTTLLAFAGVLFLIDARFAAQGALVALELAAVAALAWRWDHPPDPADLEMQAA